LNAQIALLEKENDELKLDNKRYKANIEQLWVNIEISNDNDTITKFLVIIDKKLFHIKYIIFIN
jgi:hypothetical protein